MGYKLFLKQNCYDAALERIAFIFDRFEQISVSVSSGKDSTVLYWLCLNEAIKRKRLIDVFFLDQEAEYQASIDLIEKMMVHPNVIPRWYQVPIRMTNATSYKNIFLYAWGENEEWMRPKSKLAIHSIDQKYPQRFYDFFHWKERQEKDTAFLVGIRAEESINRFRAVTKHPGYKDVLWSTQIPKNDTSFKFYPLYDWGMGDVWKYIHENNIEYNAIYDKMFCDNKSYYNTMRVSNLIHEKSFKCLVDLHKYEPDTYEKLMRRIGGIHCANLYAKDEHIYNPNILPDSFESWLTYRDYLLATTPMSKKYRLIKRFSSQPKREEIYQQQVHQILISDWENNVPVDSKRGKRQLKNKEYWYNTL